MCALRTAPNFKLLMHMERSHLSLGLTICNRLPLHVDKDRPDRAQRKFSSRQPRRLKSRAAGAGSSQPRREAIGASIQGRLYSVRRAEVFSHL